MALRYIAQSIAVLLCLKQGICSSDAEQQGACDSGSCPASLLQKTQSKHRTTLAQAQAPCTGVVAQGRCWYLSEVGETCTTTCNRYGQGFSFALADKESPITPRLVGHEPNAKQQPWAALECYVPEEDRYHTANANAAKHFDIDIGSWSYQNCKLACPCGGPVEANQNKCAWTQPPACAPKFFYKGTEYSGCTTADSEHDKPWCQHHYQHVESGVSAPADWSYCDYSCSQEVNPIPQDQKCDWQPAPSCVTEFDYEGGHYFGCTGTDHDTPWCSNTDPYEGSWNHCIYSCPDNSGNAAEQNQAALEDDTLCFWRAPQDCSQSFEYKGTEYTGCTDIDHPTPWCSHNRIHQGSWATCTRVCSKPNTPANTPTLVPIPQSISGDPCTRHPEAENDVIGATVTLDEAGYRIAASADSPINMKRFICRTVSKIGCRVVDVSSLMAFVPYYSGSVSEQTYSRLENELITLCHAGGKWVTPRN